MTGYGFVVQPAAWGTPDVAKSPEETWQSLGVT